MEREQEIRCIAYQLWQKEGQPEGRAVEHWLRAVQMVEQQEQECQSPAPIVMPTAVVPPAHLNEATGKETLAGKRGRRV